MISDISQSITSGLQALEQQVPLLEQNSEMSFSFPFTNQNKMWTGKISLGTLSPAETAISGPKKISCFLEVKLFSEDKKSDASEWLVTGSPSDIAKAMGNVTELAAKVNESLMQLLKNLQKEIP